MASVTFAPSTRTIDPPDALVLAAVAALAAVKAVQRFRTALGPVWVPAAPGGAPASAATTREPAPSPASATFDEDLMDRFLAAPTDLHDPDAGRLRRRSARRQAGAEAQWRILAQ